MAEAEQTHCVFCEKFEGIPEGYDVLNIEPLKPVVPGHEIFFSRKHTRDFSVDKDVTADVVRVMASRAQNMDHVNLIFSKGCFATQTVFHSHGHLVPRTEGDGLTLPWTAQQEKNSLAKCFPLTPVEIGPIQRRNWAKYLFGDETIEGFDSIIQRCVKCSSGVAKCGGVWNDREMEMLKLAKGMCKYLPAMEHAGAKMTLIESVESLLDAMLLMIESEQVTKAVPCKE